MKAAIEQIGQDYAFSERRECRLITMAMSSYRYRSRCRGQRLSSVKSKVHENVTSLSKIWTTL